MNKNINVQETYVEGFVTGARLVVEPFDLKDGQMVVIIQRAQTKEIHDGEEFVNLGLSWLPANEAEAKFGSIVAEMVKLAKSITKDVCGRCGRVQERKEMFKHDGSAKCKVCTDRDVAWHVNYRDTVYANRKAKNMEPLDARDIERLERDCIAVPLS